MAHQKSQKENGVNPSPSEVATEDPLEELWAMLRTYSLSDGFKHVRKTLGENAWLKKEVDKLQTSYDTNLAALTKREAALQALERQHAQDLTAEKERLKQAMEDRESTLRELKEEQSKCANKATQLQDQEQRLQNLIGQVKRKDTQIQALQEIEADRNKLRDAMASTEESLQNKTKQLAQAEDSLATVQSFIVKLEPVGSKSAEICGALQAMFDDAYGFMQEFLTSDLDDETLEEDDMWKGIRGHPAIQNAFPLPASNSSVAKELRVASGITVYGHALAKHVWRSTYIVQNNELDKALEALAYEDPLHEAYLRAVLLKVLPERQSRCKDACVKRAVADVIDGVARLVPAEQRDAFEARLKLVSSKICNHWMLVQRLEEKVEPDFSLFNACHNAWRPLPTLSGQKKPDRNASHGLPQATQSRQQMLNRQQAQDANRRANSATEGVACVVWPAFVYLSSHQVAETLLQPGYTLMQVQMAGADTDVSRRASRRVKRQNETTVPERKRRDSGIFLSSGGSNGASGIK